MKASEINYEVGDLVYRTTSDGEKERGEVNAILTDPRDNSEVHSVEVIWEEDDAYGIYDPADLVLARKAN